MVETKIIFYDFYGPPKVEKLVLLKAIAGSTEYKFRQLNAVTNTKRYANDS